MYYYKTSLLFTLITLCVSSNIYSQHGKKQILYSSTLNRGDFHLGITLFKNETDTNMVRAIVKITPITDSFKSSLQEHKTQIMFEKKGMLELITKQNERIHPIDYVYEEGYGYIYMLYTFLNIEFDSIKSLSIQDSLITNSKKIVFI